MKQGLPPGDWNKSLQMLGGSILQSQEWMLFQQQLERDVVWDAGTGWQWAAAVRGSRGVRYLMCAYGPAASGEASMNTALMSLAQAAKQLGMDFVRIEPQIELSASMLKKLGGRKIQEADPQYTQLLDLTKSEVDLRAGLASGHRNLINGTQRRGIAVRQSESPGDLEQMLAMMSDTARRSKVTFYPPNYFKTLWQTLHSRNIVTMYIAEVDSMPIASALFYDWGGTRYYAHAGAYQEQNRRVKASVSLVWQAILDAKEKGLKNFDLWGIAPSGDSTHHLAALSRFKTAFGGSQINYLGTWDIPLKPAKYAAYAAYRKLRGRG